jgi:hypothetical protein
MDVLSFKEVLLEAHEYEPCRAGMEPPSALSSAVSKDMPRADLPTSVIRQIADFSGNSQRLTAFTIKFENKQCFRASRVFLGNTMISQSWDEFASESDRLTSEIFATLAMLLSLSR